MRDCQGTATQELVHVCIGETEVRAFLRCKKRKWWEQPVPSVPKSGQAPSQIWNKQTLPSRSVPGHVNGTGRESRTFTENHRREAVPHRRKSQEGCFVGICAPFASAKAVGIEEASPGAVRNALSPFGHVSSHRSDSPRAQDRSYKSRRCPTLPYNTSSPSTLAYCRYRLASSSALEHHAALVRPDRRADAFVGGGRALSKGHAREAG